MELAGRDRYIRGGRVETGMLPVETGMLPWSAGRDRYVVVERRWRQADLETGMLPYSSKTWYLLDGRVEMR